MLDNSIKLDEGTYYEDDKKLNLEELGTVVGGSDLTQEQIDAMAQLLKMDS